MRNIINLKHIQELKALDDDGSDLILKELVHLFLENSKIRLKVFYDCFEAQDFLQLKKEAHALRSSSLNLGAELFPDILMKIEYAEENEYNTTLKEAMAEVGREHERLAEELRKML